MSFNPIKTPVATIEMLFVTIMEMCCCIMPYQSQSPELTIPMMQVRSAISSADFSLMIFMICGINNAEDSPPAINPIISGLMFIFKFMFKTSIDFTDIPFLCRDFS